MRWVILQRAILGQSSPQEAGIALKILRDLKADLTLKDRRIKELEQKVRQQELDSEKIIELELDLSDAQAKITQLKKDLKTARTRATKLERANETS